MQLLRLGQLAKVERVLEPVDTPGIGAGRDAEPVPRDRPAALELDLAMLKPQVDHSLPEHQLDAELAILLRGSQPEPVAAHGPEQEALGQVRSLVGRIVLGADKHDSAVESTIAEAGRNRVAGRPGADDYRLVGRSRSRSWRSDRNR